MPHQGGPRSLPKGGITPLSSSPLSPGGEIPPTTGAHRGRSSYSPPGESFPTVGDYILPTGGVFPHRRAGRSSHSLPGESFPTVRDHHTPHRGSLSPSGEIITLPTAGGVFPHRGRPSYSPPGESFPTGGDHHTPHRGSFSPPGENTYSPPGEFFPTGGDHHTPHRGSLSPPGEIIILPVWVHRSHVLSGCLVGFCVCSFSFVTVSRNLRRSTCSGLCIPLVFPVPHKTAFEATLSRLDASPPPHMSETVVLYPLTTVIQLVIVCLSCNKKQ
jgi:hypothetical protein